jgi:peptidoglycan-N-acetylmuramic acid deacetylase
MILPVITSQAQNASSWYVKRNAEHKQPILDTNMQYIEKYDAYYVDKSKAESDDKVIYLTFDAGYENGNVERIVDTLIEEKVPAAFFVLDNIIIKNTELVNKMAENNLLVCNHTLKHRDMTKITNIEEFKNELISLESVYKEKTGREMAKYYRPPEGKFSEENLAFAKELGYKTIFWSFAYADWDNEKQPTKEYAMKKILDNTHNGAVILLHPTSRTNADIMPALIKELKNQGYRFGTLDELTK